MAEAALFLSGLSIVVSIGVAIYVRQAADKQSTRSDTIQERLAAVEEARRRDELKPDLRGIHDWSVEAVRLTNHGPVDLESIRWSFLVDISRHALLGLGRPPLTEGELPGLPIGASSALAVEIDRNADPDQGEVVLTCECRAGGERWVVAVPVSIWRS